MSTPSPPSAFTVSVKAVYSTVFLPSPYFPPCPPLLHSSPYSSPCCSSAISDGSTTLGPSLLVPRGPEAAFLCFLVSAPGSPSSAGLPGLFEAATLNASPSPFLHFCVPFPPSVLSKDLPLTRIFFFPPKQGLLLTTIL